jgi:methylase of polypeptide subunit release factors
MSKIWSFAKRMFMTVWYPYVRLLNTTWPSIKIAGKRLVIAPDVYKPLENEHGCADYCNAGDRVLDLGCGSGVCAIFVAPKAREVLAVDISPSAVQNTKDNCKLLGLDNVTVRQSDMFSGVDGKFDLILANPPYIAVEFEKEEEQFATSVRFMPTLFAQAGNYLTEDGRLLVQFPIWFRNKVEKLGAAHGFELLEVKRTPNKSIGLFLLSLAYTQVGFRSAFYLFRPKSGAEAASSGHADTAKAPRAAAQDPSRHLKQTAI